MRSPEAELLRGQFASLVRRARLLLFVKGLTVGLSIAALIWFVWGVTGGLTASVISVIIGLVWSSWRRPTEAVLAIAVERAVPEARNVVVTAEQLLRSDVDATPVELAELIFGTARRIVDQVPTATVLPARRTVMLLAASLIALTFGAFLHGGVVASSLSAGVADGGAVTIRVVPPAYLGRAEQRFSDPARLTVMRGSRIAIEVRDAGDSVEFRTATEQRFLAKVTDGRASGSFVADSDGFVALRTYGAGAGLARLIPIAVDVDSAPRVVITTPGRDLLLPNGKQSVSISLKASDDIGLKSLVLRYTRVSGSGERFTFTEGEVPIVIARRSDREWEGNTKWDLAPLKLDAGDMVVYRAIATDGRPGEIPVESDALIAEVASPGGVAAAGFALDPEQERYALSQQMVILKTERLLAAKARMQPDSFAGAAAEIAMEQRRVRAEFVFMMGGEMEDAPAATDDASMTDLNEEAEAAGEDELAAGRMVNRGRVALLGSIRNMSRAAAALTAVDVATALGHEKTALKQLESAFSHSRIILRALADRERLDLTRRLGGALSDALRSQRPAPALALPADAVAALALVREGSVLELSDTASGVAISALAERALRLGPGDAHFQRASNRWSAAAVAVHTHRTADAREALDDGVLALQQVIRERVGASHMELRPASSVLSGALRDASSSGIRGRP